LAADGRLVRLDRIRQVAARVERVAEIVVSLCVVAITLLDGRAVRGDGFINLAEVVKRDAEIMPGDGEFLCRVGRGAAQRRRGVFERAFLVEREAEAVMRQRVGWPLLDGGAIRGDGGGESAKGVVNGTEVEERCGHT